MRILLLWIGALTTACGGSQQSPSELFSYEVGLRFPDHPDQDMTPGETCHTPSEYRYPEKIAYCRRNVKKALKDDIIRTYDREFDFQIGRMNRMDFKIDHYISLCMGGSNSRENLWPQHKSVYVHTDPIEEKLCRLMQKGRISQDEAIDTIRFVKNNLEEAAGIRIELERKLGD